MSFLVNICTTRCTNAEINYYNDSHHILSSLDMFVHFPTRSRKAKKNSLANLHKNNVGNKIGGCEIYLLVIRGDKKYLVHGRGSSKHRFIKNVDLSKLLLSCLGL